MKSISCNQKALTFLLKAFKTNRIAFTQDGYKLSFEDTPKSRLALQECKANTLGPIPFKILQP